MSKEKQASEEGDAWDVGFETGYNLGMADACSVIHVSIAKAKLPRSMSATLYRELERRLTDLDENKNFNPHEWRKAASVVLATLKD